jgi:hypothetical protein
MLVQHRQRVHPVNLVANVVERTQLVDTAEISLSILPADTSGAAIKIKWLGESGLIWPRPGG